jgi:hypothetical protein
MISLALILSSVGINTEELDNRPTHAQAIAIAKENRATIYFPIVDKKKARNNLGWLLRHWKDLEHIEIISSFCGKDGWCVLVAKVWVSYWGKECYYITKFASRTVCEEWIDRPIFHGVKVIKTDLKYSDDVLTLGS